MKTKRFKAAALFLFLFVGAIAPTANCADKKAIQQQTNRAYYNLKSHGLAEFRCNVLFDWDGSFSGMKTDATWKETILPIAKQMKFQVSVGPTGAASVSHEFGQAPPSQAVADRLRQVSEGIDQMLGGFFETWSQLMIKPPLGGDPEAYQVEENPDGYRITDKDNSAITMKRDFVIDTVEAKTSEFEGVVRPKFFKSADGELLMESYDVAYTANGGASQRLSVAIQYQTVDGLLLPRTIKMSMALSQGQLDWPMTLDSCQVKKQ